MLNGWLKRFAGWWLVAAALAVFVATPLPAAAAPPSALLSQKAPEAAKIANVAERQGYVSIIVEFAPPIPRSAMRPNRAVLDPLRARIRSIQDDIIASHFSSATNPRAGRGFNRGIRRLDISPMFAVNVDAAELEALAADPRVLQIHEDALLQPLLEQSVPLIGMPAAYTAGATGNGYAVAVVDTGVKSDHPFLAGKVILEACFSKRGGAGQGTSTCPNGQSTQTGAGAASPTSPGCLNGSTNVCYHGTHVAGIAAGLNATNISGAPPSGVAKSASIVSVQVFTKIGSSVSAYTSDIIAGLNYVYSNLNNLPGGIKVAAVNMSLGGGSYSSPCNSDAMKPSIDNLLAAGVATVVAAGNDGSTHSVTSPGCIPSAIAVASSTKGDVISSFSNMAGMVDLIAPGGTASGLCDGSTNSDIHSSLVTNTSSTFGCLAGTSMATPHVAGAFAAIKTALPNATVAQILSALQTTGLSIQDTRSGGSVTKPRIRVSQALQSLPASLGTVLVTPATNISASGLQGGPFSPSSFNYTFTSSTGTQNYSISGVPTWLTASLTSGTATMSGNLVSFSVNSSANSLAPATYNATITVTDTSGNTIATTITAVLTVNPLPALQVSPATDIGSSGFQGGPFSPGSFQYQLSATTGSVNYSISGVPAWLNVSSSSGTLTTSPTTITFTVNSSANSLTPNSYNATVSFANTTNSQGNQSRGAALTVNPLPALQVSPATTIASSGYQGGPFSPASFQYQLSATSGSVNYSISGVPTWLDVSSSSGTLTTSPTTITFTVNSSANSLTPNSYNATVSFTNTTNGQGTQSRGAALTVNVLPALQVSPATNIASLGNQGGPFAPGSFQYQLSATVGTVDYSISGVPAWLDVSSTTGTLTTTPTTITFTVNSSANGLVIGTYSGTINFDNTTNGQGNQTRNAALQINYGGASLGFSGRRIRF